MMSFGDSLPEIPQTVISFGINTNIYLFNYFATIPKLFVLYMHLYHFPIGWTVSFSSVYPLVTHIKLPPCNMWRFLFDYSTLYFTLVLCPVGVCAILR